MSSCSFWSSFLFCKYCIYFFIKLCDYFSRSRTPSPSLFNRPRPLHPSSASTPILSLYSLYNYPRPLHPASVSTSGLILYFHQQPLHPASASTSLQSVSEKPHTPAIIYAYFRSYIYCSIKIVYIIVTNVMSYLLKSSCLLYFPRTVSHIKIVYIIHS